MKLHSLKYFPNPDGKAAVVELKGEKETLWTSRQHAKVMAEVRKHCANYREGCLLMDGYGCILETSLHPCCNYFRDSVSPTLTYEFPEASRKCQLCGKPFQPKSNRGKYCTECAKKRRREKERDRLRKLRE